VKIPPNPNAVAVLEKTIAIQSKNMNRGYWPSVRSGGIGGYWLSLRQFISGDVYNGKIKEF
jgi:hypothetical protein